MAGSVALTLLAFSEDRSNSPRCCDRGSQLAGRSCACNRGRSRDSSAGAVTLLREDRENRGRVLFAAHCASCHRYNGHSRGYPVDDKQSAPELAGFASVEWVTRLLTHEHYVSEEYFGGTLKTVTWQRKYWPNTRRRKRPCYPKLLFFCLIWPIYLIRILLARMRERNLSLFYNDDADFEDGLACIDCHDIDSKKKAMLQI